jgi:hypothetical protein
MIRILLFLYKIIVRQNNVDEKTCNPQTTVVFCCNDIPKIEPHDVYEKLIPFPLKSKFVEEKITPELLKENPYYKKSDEGLRTKVNNEEWIINGVTNLIINSCSQTGTAARICNDYSIDGYSDWYLPSFIELKKLKENLYSQNLGNFQSGGVYWSSTQYNASAAYAVTFSIGGYEGNYITNDQMYRVRPVRSF